MATTIEWTDETWNPITGCTKISPGCANCYAERMAKRLAGRYGYPADDPFRVTLHPDRLEQPLRWRKPRMVFVCSMGDIFHEDVPDTMLEQIWQVMFDTPQHTYQVLTKRPERMLDWISRSAFLSNAPLSNVWLGVTAENQEMADRRIPLLLQVPATVRFVSVEPMLSPINLWRFATCEETFGSMYDHRPTHEYYRKWLTLQGIESDGQSVKYHSGIDWVICGGETGPGARPMDPAWARNLRDQCQAAGVAYFFKQMSNRDPIPADLMIREFPRVQS